MYISNKNINHIKMSDHEGGNDNGNDNGTDTCQAYQDLGDIISDQRDDCTNATCAAAVDFSASAAYYAASVCYSSKK